MKKWVIVSFILSISVFLLLFIFVIVVTYHLSDLHDSVNKLREFYWELFDDVIMRVPSVIVDFSEPIVQDINRGFMVVDLSVEQYLTGVKVKGRIINSTALTHTNLTFQISIDEHRKDFHINRISSGNSTRFEVYVPDVPLEETRLGKIVFTGSNVHYRR